MGQLHHIENTGMAIKALECEAEGMDPSYSEDRKQLDKMDVIKKKLQADKPITHEEFQLLSTVIEDVVEGLHGVLS